LRIERAEVFNLDPEDKSAPEAVDRVYAKRVGDRARLLSVLLPRLTREPAPELRDLTSGGAPAAQVKWRDGIDLHLAPSPGRRTSAAGLTSDGLYGYARQRAGSVVDWLACGATYLAVEGRPCLEADRTVTVGLRLTGPDALSGALWTDEPAALTIGLPPGRRAAAVTLAGAAVQHQQAADQVRFTAADSGALDIRLRPR